ncbi:MAG: gas vesicle protein GvpA [Betaproteobacteria bacterium RIFCSPLOWO2_12_FULL_62_13b]|nr:MAG: gas vesicle protein GvpA [Betaproteobacteria bacterium RIFCSPLOWO2_12_FULL_62_13b]
MAVPKRTHGSMTHAVESATLADVLERILDKGLVIAGDIKIKLVDIELLTIQIRLLVCSVEKAREMGIDWWTTNAYLSSGAAPEKSHVEDLGARIARLEEALQAPQALVARAESPAHS